MARCGIRAEVGQVRVANERVTARAGLSGAAVTGRNGIKSRMHAAFAQSLGSDDDHTAPCRRRILEGDFRVGT